MALSYAEERRILAWADNGSQRLEQVYNALVTLLGRPLAQVDEEALATSIVPKLAPLLSVLPDSDLERIRDACVEALELSKGTLNATTNIMRFNRVAQ